MTRFTTACTAAALAASVAWAAPSRAQEYLPTATAQLASGIESGGKGVSRARTRMRVGVDLRIDEMPEDLLSAGLLLDMEPRAAVGADLRYGRMIGAFTLSGGPAAYFVPGTLLGACASGTYRIPKTGRFALGVGPEATTYFIGSDLPDGRVMWQVLLQAGLRVDL